MLEQLEPVETGDLEAEVIPEAIRSIAKKRCSPAIKQFVHNALRALEHKEIDEFITVPVQSFHRLGLDNKYRIISTLESCPESEHMRIDTTDDEIMMIKVSDPDVKPVKQYKGGST